MAIRRRDYDKPGSTPPLTPVYLADATGTPLPDLRDAEGVPYTSILPGKPGRKMCLKGAFFTAAEDATTDHDLTFAESREIQGSWVEVADHEAGDYVELYVCAPNGQSVGQFGETVYIPPSGKIDQSVSEATVGFPPGFRLRMRYVATPAGGTRHVYAWYWMRK